MIVSDTTVDSQVLSLKATGADTFVNITTPKFAAQAIRRAKELGHLREDGTLARQVVTIHAHQHWPFFRTGGEFYPRVAAFADVLREAGIVTTVRKTRGDDIAAACGQLAGEVQDRTRVHQRLTRQPIRIHAAPPAGRTA